jgi:hypothetical protein
MSEPTMTLITSEWGQGKTFRLMPIQINCPYVEGIYDTEGKVLVLISKIKKQTFHMLGKLDEQGDTLKLKRPRANGKPFPEERKIVDTFQEYYITEKTEIEEMVKGLAKNADSFDYKQYLEKDIMMVEKPKIEIVQK